MTKLFHRDIFLPAGVRNLAKRSITPRITRHAEGAAMNDRYGRMTIPATVTFSGADVIEAEIATLPAVGAILRKLVVRLPYDATKDIVLAIGFDNGQSFVKTVWANLKTDRHSTLKRHLYATA